MIYWSHYPWYQTDTGHLLVLSREMEWGSPLGRLNGVGRFYKEVFNDKIEELMKYMNKKIISVIIFLVVIVIAGILIWQFWPEPTVNIPISNNTPTSTPSSIDSSINTTIDKTANWQIFKDQKYGFEIRYPDGAGVEKYSYDGDSLVITNITEVVGSLNIEKLLISNDQAKFVSSELSPNATECRPAANDSELEGFYSFKETKQINDMVFYHYANYPEFIGAFMGMHSGASYRDVYRISNGKNCYEFVYTRNYQEFSQSEEVPNLIYDILSTCKFLP